MGQSSSTRVLTTTVLLRQAYQDANMARNVLLSLVISEVLLEANARQRLFKVKQVSVLHTTSLNTIENSQITKVNLIVKESLLSEEQ